MIRLLINFNSADEISEDEISDTQLLPRKVGCLISLGREAQFAVAHSNSLSAVRKNVLPELKFRAGFFNLGELRDRANTQ